MATAARRLALLLLAMAALAGCGGGSDESATTTAEATTTTEEATTEASANAQLDPKLLVAQLSDLPTGYSIDQEETGPTGLQRALQDKTPEEAALVRAERVAGYEILFESPKLRAIYCSAVVYRTTGGAEELYRLGVDQISATAKKEGGKAERASISEELGDERAAFNVEMEGLSSFMVVWRDENVIGVCVGGGPLATDPAETVLIAQAQQERMAAALD
jgi:hypothetical protein